MSLVGLSGTGKSSVAPLVARRTGRVAVDLDDLVQQQVGSTIAELFEVEGEQAFRRRELEALESTLEGPAAVVATGGGVVTTPQAAGLLSSRTTVVWLDALPAQLAPRLSADEEARPLLAGNALERLEQMHAERGPLYESLADVVIDVSAGTPEAIADAVTASIGLQP